MPKAKNIIIENIVFMSLNKIRIFIYEGSWSNNFPHGFGTFTFNDIIIKYIKEEIYEEV